MFFSSPSLRFSIGVFLFPLGAGCSDPVEPAPGASTDVSDPSIEFLSPVQATFIEADSVRIIGLAADDRAIDSLAYSIDQGPLVPVEVSGAPVLSFTVTLHPEPGDHVVRFVANDASGNSHEHAIQFTIGHRFVINSSTPDTAVNAFTVALIGTIEPAAETWRITSSLNGGDERLRCRSSWYLNACGYRHEGRTKLQYLTVDSLPQGTSEIVLTAYNVEGRKLAVGRTSVNVAVPVKRYALVYLGTLGGEDSWGADLNEEGDVVGWSYDREGAKRAFLWDGSRMTEVSPGLGSESVATAINDSGLVLGDYTSDCPRVFRYRPGVSAPMELVDGCDRRSVEVNDAGVALIYEPHTSATDPGMSSWARQAWLVGDGWIERLAMEDGVFQELLQLNEQGQVLGNLGGSFYGVDPALFTTTHPPIRVGNCFGVDMNDAGVLAVRGGCKTSTSGTNGTVDGYPVSAIGYSPGSNARANSVTNPSGINNHGQAVGHYVYARTFGGEGTMETVYRAFFWDGERSYSVEYPEVDWQIDQVHDLNDSGSILAHAINTPTGKRGAVLLNPVH